MTQRSNMSPLERVQAIFSHNPRAFYCRFTDAEIDLILNGSSHNPLNSVDLLQELTEAFQIDHPHYVRTLSITRLHDQCGNRDTMRILTEKAGSFENVFVERPAFQSYAGVHQSWILNEIQQVLIQPRQKMYIGRTPKNQIEEIAGGLDYYVQIPEDPYATIETWWSAVLDQIHHVELIISDAQTITPIIAKRLWHTNHEVQYFDIGMFMQSHQEIQSRKWASDEHINDVTDEFFDDELDRYIRTGSPSAN